MANNKYPSNRFYNTFDQTFFQEPETADYRTPFQKDRDRIIHSSALRRLQAKTQVFLSGEYDFYRTRLTHSIEVAQIGRSICHYLAQSSHLLSPEFYIDPDLVEAICLAHDLGHPPFGHSGEATLNRLMRDHGGFEGNAQTLRIITETIYSENSHRKGMNPTRAFIDGVLKYKTLRRHSPDAERYFLYDHQEKYRQFVFNSLSLPAALPSGEALNGFRSVECQIMDWADDTAYSLNDMLDGVNARFINIQDLEKWGAAQQLTSEQNRLLEQLFNAIRSRNVRKNFSQSIGDFIKGCRLKERKNFMSDLSNRYRYQLEIDPLLAEAARFYKRLAAELVFSTAQLQQLRYKWDKILEKIFSGICSNYLDSAPPWNKLLPPLRHQMVIAASDPAQKMRIICDHISGMTDGFAIRTYKRLFDPNFGFFADLL